MKLAFYYHVPIHQDEEGIHVPGYLGVFIDALAENVVQLFLVMHAQTEDKYVEADYNLKSKNIVWINLGFKTSPLNRIIFPSRILKKKINKIEICDAFLIRSPTPLAHTFDRFIKNPKIFFMIVGDYAEGANQIGKKGIKNLLLYYFFKFVDYKFRAKMTKTNVFVNSPQLFEKYKAHSLSIDLIKTTTLRKTDFFKKINLEFGETIKLLYTGRIDPSKGLFELIEACSILNNSGLNAVLNIVGWEENKSKPFENELKQFAIKLGIDKRVNFLGKKKIGEDLNRMYRENDIFVLASYHEGFPRTVWEAMANSIPIVVTKVGGIPYYLEDEKHALLITPKSSKVIVNAVLQLINNLELRKKLILNSYNLANENTIELQTFLMIEALKVHLKHQL